MSQMRGLSKIDNGAFSRPLNNNIMQVTGNKKPRKTINFFVVECNCESFYTTLKQSNVNVNW